MSDDKYPTTAAALIALLAEGVAVCLFLAMLLAWAAIIGGL